MPKAAMCALTGVAGLVNRRGMRNIRCLAGNAMRRADQRPIELSCLTRHCIGSCSLSQIYHRCVSCRSRAPDENQSLIDRIEVFSEHSTNQLVKMNADPFVFHPGNVTLSLNVVAFHQQREATGIPIGIATSRHAPETETLRTMQLIVP
jgi:hypothetical protein